MIDAINIFSCLGQRIATFGSQNLKIHYRFCCTFYTSHHLISPPFGVVLYLYGKLKVAVAHQHFYISVATVCTYLQSIHSEAPHSAYSYTSEIMKSESFKSSFFSCPVKSMSSRTFCKIYYSSFSFL